MLGEFEYLVLAAISRLGENAYGAAIRRALADLDKPTTLGALYTTLDRMEKKGLVTRWMGEATAARGGRSKRMVALTVEGRRAASDFHKIITRASQHLDWVEG